MIEIVDSHAHLDDGRFQSDLDAVMARATEAGIAHVVIPATDTTSWPHIHDLCSNYPRTHPAYGLHPMFLGEDAPAHVDALSSWLDDHHAVAVGEIGLDFHVEGIDHDLQRRIFARQLDIARARGLPVIVHARGALEEVILTLRRVGGLRGVVHSFSGSEQQAQHLWDIGFCLGIGGPVTYERAQRLRRIVSHMPLEFLLLESDAPDQPDAAHRGQRNEPARVADVLRCIAALRDESEAEIAAATTANAHRLFGLAQRNA
ncbi:DNAase [Rhodanobacter sp. Root627]|uniref:TatD family hydrolase n=1 Tax=Rhodanobacter sp. Root627 TaxID=1736572 RepID=UPI0006FFAD1D|nr:TatD family hydrolase [Rhodanobacter sp. Root627]KRA35203.1 DNAase [Rhodanobacter sp. Root627]